MIKYGLKLWSNNSIKLFHEAQLLVEKGEIDFVELYIVPQTFEKNLLKPLKKIPITIHATHAFHGFNLAQKNDSNFALFKQVKQFADFLKSQKIVVHPGYNGNLKTAKENLKKIADKRILVENMPFRALKKLGGGTSVGAKLNEIEEILALGFNLCLDFGHAIKSSISQNLNYKSYIQKFLHLNPRYFHITDGSLTSKYDEHFNLGSGKFDIHWIKQELKRVENPYIVFETPKKDSNLKNDLKNLRYFKSL